MRILNFLLCTALSLGSGTAFAGWSTYVTLFTENQPVSVHTHVLKDEDPNGVWNRLKEKIQAQTPLSDQQATILARLCQESFQYCLLNQTEKENLDLGENRIITFETKTQLKEGQEVIKERIVSCEEDNDLQSYVRCSCFNEE
jgi:hypothetical protein